MRFNDLELYKSMHKVVRQEEVARRILTIFEDGKGRYEYITLITTMNGVKKGSSYGWHDLESANKYIDEQIENYKKSEENKKIRREESKEAAKKFLEGLQVGDILCSTWGYEAIWYDFYKVVGKQGSFVLLRELKKNVSHDNCQYGFASYGIVSPSDEFEGDEVIKRKAGDGCVRINSFSYAFRWDGKAREEANWH